MDLDDDYAESDIPTTLIRSKVDCPQLEVGVLCQTDSIDASAGQTSVGI